MNYRTTRVHGALSSALVTLTLLLAACSSSDSSGVATSASPTPSPSRAAASPSPTPTPSAPETATQRYLHAVHQLHLGVVNTALLRVGHKTCRALKVADHYADAVPVASDLVDGGAHDEDIVIAASAKYLCPGERQVAQMGATARSAARSEAARRKAAAKRQRHRQAAASSAAASRAAKSQAAASRAARSSAAAPAPTQCTTTSSGSCIQGGEFCPQASYGQQGTDADGDVYTCTGDTTHPHWE